ncbi:hypothetical protein HCJ26_04795 [Listeria welshimeri]|uniref:hypothetical protein n=1 Tax=Listeria welshimeri TaxID=1643 RepID=UPI00162932D3|nr:hypothetical protein [Listeria welshimeri]MBC1952689.1 hypothetical protein [Listeria welshimeri]MBF2613143.1 hypothetical protein [Listeria welshimeri]
MKKEIVNLLLVLTIGFSLSISYSDVIAETIETDVTVKIIRDDAIESESSKDREGAKGSENQEDIKKKKESKVSEKLPKTSDFINPFITFAGMLFFVIGIIGININNKRNGANNNEKN